MATPGAVARLLAVLSVPLLLLLLCAVASAAGSLDAAVERTVLLPGRGSLITYERIVATLTNRGASAVDKVPFKLPPDAAKKFAFLAAYDGALSAMRPSHSDSVLDTAYPTTPAIPGLTSGSKKFEGTIKLLKALKPGATEKITIFAVFNGTVRPVPTEIDQDGAQKLTYESSAGVGIFDFMSKYSLIIKMGTDKEPTYYTSVNGKTKKTRYSVTYGPFEKDPLNTKIEIHFNENAVGLAAASWRKEIWVRGNDKTIEFDDHVHVYHRGASIRGHFSRLNIMRNDMENEGNVVKAFILVLPFESRQMFFRDDIGNVSTSSIVTISNQKILYLRPRFPLYGGWNYNWNHGFEIPASTYISSSDESNDDKSTFVAEIPFLSSTETLEIDDLEIRIVLPEAAIVDSVKVDQYGRNLKMQRVPSETPIAALMDDHYAVDRKFYYFDTVGRPVVIIKRRRWVNFEDFGRAPRIIITYTLTTQSYILKPIVITSSLFVVLVSVVLWILNSGNSKAIRGERTNFHSSDSSGADTFYPKRSDRKNSSSLSLNHVNTQSSSSAGGKKKKKAD